MVGKLQSQYFLAPFVIGVICFIASPYSHAGELVQLVDGYISSSAKDGSVATLLSQAREEELKARQSAYYPSIYLDISQVRRKQTFTGNSSPPGTSEDFTFNNSQHTFKLKQPIYDPQKLGNIEFAKINSKASIDYIDVETQEATKEILDLYIEAAMYGAISDSYKRSLDRINKELDITEERFKYKLVTIHDLDTIKLHRLDLIKDSEISSAKYHNLLAMLKNYQEPSLALKVNRLPADGDLLKTLQQPQEVENLTNTADILDLRSEVSRFRQEAENAKLSRLPRLNFIANYYHDNAPEKTIAQGTSVDDYEIGLKLEWDIFSGGESVHRLQEAVNTEKSRQILLDKKMRERAVAYTQAKNEFELDKQSLDYQKQILLQRGRIRDAMEKGFQGGTETYLATIDAVLLYESGVRDFEMTQYRLLKNYVALKAITSGMQHDDVVFIDGLFK